MGRFNVVKLLGECGAYKEKGVPIRVIFLYIFNQKVLCYDFSWQCLSLMCFLVCLPILYIKTKALFFIFLDKILKNNAFLWDFSPDESLRIKTKLPQSGVEIDINPQRNLVRHHKSKSLQVQHLVRVAK